MAATPADQPLDPDRDLSQEELVADIEQTRAQLGDTVDALAQKLDVKAQARARADATKLRLRQQVTSLRSISRRVGDKAKDVSVDRDGRVAARVPVAAVSTVVVLLAAILLRRRRVHGDQCSAARFGDAEVAPEAGVGRGRATAVDPHQPERIEPAVQLNQTGVGRGRCGGR